ncbi:MAG: hypothetical protein MJE77_34185, partial [Proteobacteria bacterium]|nr:hypothetical protein [Pseudomonadota bacterium]
PSQSDEARRQWVGEEWRILAVFDRRASPLAVMDRRSGDAESFWTGSYLRGASLPRTSRFQARSASPCLAIANVAAI